MPLARIITNFPEECDQLRRQLLAAGYSVQFASPDEDVEDADLIVAAANVHSDYALQYAAEVARESGCDVIVAPGLVPNTAAPEPVVAEPVETESERHPSAFAALAERWQLFRAKRGVRREQQRLERERRAAEAEEQRQQALRIRAEQEARAAAERERLRLQRQAEEQERLRAFEAERACLAAEAERLLVEQELLRAQRQAEERQLAEEARRRAAEAEQARIAAEHERLLSAPSPIVIPPEALPVAPAAAPRALHGPYPTRTARQSRMQRALLAASVVALVAMIIFAVVMNTPATPPLSNRIVNSTVHEEAPFGPARTTAQAPVPNQSVRPATRATVPPRAAAPRTEAAKPTPEKRVRPAHRRSRGYVAQDEVIIHHYGTRKHPQSSTTRAGIPHYSDQQ